MKIQESLLTKNKFSRCGVLLKAVRGVVIHYTGNPGASAIANRNYFESLKEQNPALPESKLRYASAHYIVGLKGEVIRCLPDTEIGYHVGAVKYTNEALQRLSSSPNNCTIGIEVCVDKAGNFTGAALESCRELAGELLARNGLTKADLWRHYDITGKICPKPFVDDAEAWEAFRENVGKTENAPESPENGSGV
jgi:N-acetylmuramoyl-L-alanine amidase